jgi:hypothetical protein
MPADIRAEKRVAIGVCLEDASGCHGGCSLNWWGSATEGLL